MIRITIIFFLFATGIILISCSEPDYKLELIGIEGPKKQWGPVTLTFHLPEFQRENEQLSSEKFDR